MSGASPVLPAADAVRRARAAQWVADHGDVLYAFALRRVRDADIATDVVQDTFLAALRGTHAEHSTERTWLIGILKHKLSDHFRRTTRAASGSDDGALARLDNHLFDRRGRWQGRTPPPLPLPSDAIERRELGAALRSCMTRLPRRVGQVFCLRELDALPTADISALLGISADNVWQALHRARLLLRTCLIENGYASRRPGKRP